MFCEHSQWELFGMFCFTSADVAGDFEDPLKVILYTQVCHWADKVKVGGGGGGGEW